MAKFYKLILKHGQASLEVALVLAALTILVLAAVKGWRGINDNLVDRLSEYEKSRHEAGSSDPGEWNPSGPTFISLF
ncbi:MAG: hypothetical protein NC914_00035 [Candidatus Omnitrophica bacterium]|nr:hypothetical protein [Candidatus Omnitrophota bacterium]